VGQTLLDASCISQLSSKQVRLLQMPESPAGSHCAELEQLSVRLKSRGLASWFSDQGDGCIFAARPRLAAGVYSHRPKTKFNQLGHPYFGARACQINGLATMLTKTWAHDKFETQEPESPLGIQ